MAMVMEPVAPWLRDLNRYLSGTGAEAGAAQAASDRDPGRRVVQRRRATGDDRGSPELTIVTCPNCGTRNRLRPTCEGVPRCAACQTLLPWIVDADDGSFDEETRASVPVVVDFWAPWCGSCKWVVPAVDRMAEERAGKLKVVRVDVDAAPATADRYGIQSIPTLMTVRDGKEVDRMTGAAAKPQLDAWLDRQLASV